METALLLAAGEGRKCWPFQEVRNKCTLPVANRPAVRRLAEAARAAGYREFVVVVRPEDRSVRAAFADWEGPLTWVEQPRPLGTADAATRALAALGGERDVTILCGDLVTSPENLRALRETFVTERSPAVALVQPLAGEPPGLWITCDVRRDAVANVQGHGRGGSHRLAGAYALSAAATRHLATTPNVMTHVPVGGMPPVEAEVAETIALLAERGEVRSVVAPGFLVDLDKPWHILEANRAFLLDRFARLEADEIAPGAKIAGSAEIAGRLLVEPGAEIGERVVVRGNLWLEAGARVTNGAIVSGDCLVGAGTQVRDYALVGASVLGPRAIVGHGAEFTGVLFEGAYLYHYCEIYGVLGNRVDIGAATVCGTLRFDDDATEHRIGGKRERPRAHANASYLGDYSRTGVNAILMPGVKVGAYSCVGPGVILYDDVPSRRLVMAKQELVIREWGPERYGW